MRLIRALGVLLVAAAVWVAWEGRHPQLVKIPAKPSVLLITVDTQRPDRLGCYGDARVHTPAVDRLAQEGTLFENAYCDIPWTTGSMASVMTSAYSNVHGIQLPMHRLRKEAVTLAEVLAANGYQTAAIIGSFPLDSIYGLDQGFDVYDDEFTLPMMELPGKRIRRVPSRLEGDIAAQQAFVFKKLTNDAYRPDDAVTNRALRWIMRQREPARPFFLWAHYFGPHEKINLGKGIPEQESDIIAAYDADVETADRAVGRLLEGLRTEGLLDSTLVIYHADHGQSLGEHHYVGHGMDLYEVSVRVPLIIRYPEFFPAGRKRADLARNVDIRPTILDVLGIPGTGKEVGRSLREEDVEPLDSHPQPIVYLETYAPTILLRPIQTLAFGTVLGPVMRRGILTSRWKLLVESVVGSCSRGGRVERTHMGEYHLEDSEALGAAQCRQIKRIELYDTRGAGEEEGTNVASAHLEQVRLLLPLLESFRTGHTELREVFDLSPEEKAKLKSLGYLQ